MKGELMREKLIELFLAGMGFTDNKQLLIPTSELYHLADYLISNGVGIREKGEWIEEDGVQICSNCGEEHEWVDYRAPFCDQCGAIMD